MRTGAKHHSYVKFIDLAARRKLQDLTIGPIIIFTMEAILARMNKLLEIPESKNQGRNGIIHSLSVCKYYSNQRQRRN
ncbi:unnamed protein product [Lactuca virosa]|uniref:Uncharacterized protein n=1 Tax=Lactuca virosa TaxID=75947 RepID=A0AAU9MZR3_9ASTR|nr:unnamed protein product [Lactuca virosa]